MTLPHQRKPCANCPFRTDCLKGWLGEDRMIGILEAESFICHKKNNLQCAGHMLLNGQHNGFVRLTTRLHIDLKLTGKELVFDSKEACIAHHK